MTTHNGLSNTGVKTSSKALDGLYSSQGTPSIIFTRLRVVLKALHLRNASIQTCTLRYRGGRHSSGKIPEHDDVPTDVSSTLRVGDTLVTLIFMADVTHLSNFAAENMEWPECMTIGNISSKFRPMPSTHSVVMVALLPIPIKNSNIAQNRLDE